MILFLILAITGMSMSGIAVALNKDRKLFVDEESKIEMTQKITTEMAEKEKLKS